jgi:hypothetical protein
MRQLPSGSLVGTLLRSRRTCAIVSLAAAVQLLLVRLNLPSWPCPVLKLTGCPCAGCGVSRSLAAAASGRLAEALAYHLFGPLIAGVLGLLVLGALCRDQDRLRLARFIERCERSGLTLLLLLALLAYWLFRLIWLGGDYVRLMAD